MDEFWRMFFAFSWVWIPITAIIVGGVSEWLKFKAKQQKLGLTTGQLEESVDKIRDELRSEHEDLVRRIQNLEAIVTSQTWDQLHDGSPSAEQKRRLMESVMAPPEPPNDEQRAAALAQRLRS